MSFLETISRAREVVREHGRISLRALAREFDLDETVLEELASELVEVQRVALREGDVLCWASEEADVEPVIPHAERRQLTVLFCDLVGSTELATGRDPEDWREIVRDYHAFATQIMEHYDGHVAQLLGDGILIYFGFPQAHEDDPERAVRAGLELIEGLPAFNERLSAERGLRLSTRIGIHTGRVVVGEMGDGTRRETLALGETTNLAARLQDEAPPDGVVVSTNTLQLVRGIFLTEDLGHRTLKGIPESVSIHRVLRPTGVRGRLHLAQGHLTPFAGREQELGLLLERWDQCEEGHGQTVLLFAEAGVGKSRLSLATRERLSDTPHIGFECRCSPYTQGSAFRPFVELLEQGLGIHSDDGAEARLQKIEAGVARDKPNSKTIKQLFADLLDVPSASDPSVLEMAPELKRERTLDALVSWVLSLAEIHPVFLLVEDLHWCDPSSLELLGRLIKQLPTSRLLALLTARPEFEVPWPGPTRWTTIALGRLRERQARELIAAIGKDRPLPERAVNQIVERSGGVALYLEELTLAALSSEETDGHPPIPTSLQDSLMARLDRLSSAKDVAHMGAVIGREFEYSLLEAISELNASVLQSGLRRLVDAAVLFRRGTPPRSTYTFRHALLQEIAYESLLRKRRQEIHLRIASALEERFPERVEAQPEELARHHGGAGNWVLAVEGYVRAGERATHRSAYAEGVAHFTRATELLHHLPESPDRDRREMAVRSALGPPLIGIRGYGNPEVGSLYERIRELSIETSDARPLYESIWGLANYHQARPDLPLALDLGEQLVEMATDTEDSQLLSWAHLQYGATQFWMGNYSASKNALERSITSYAPAEDQFLPGAPDSCVAAWAYSALNYWNLGQNGRALAASEEGIQLGGNCGHAFSEAIALCFAGSLHQLRGDAQRTREMAETVIPLASDHGFPVWRGWGGLLLGWSMAQSGEGESGLSTLESALVEIGSTGTALAAPAGLVMLVLAQQATGDWASMQQTAESALAMAIQSNQHAWDSELRRLHTIAVREQLGPDDPAVGEGFQSAFDLARQCQSLPFSLRAATSLAEHWRYRGDEARASGLLADALALYPGDAECPDRSRSEELLQSLA